MSSSATRARLLVCAPALVALLPTSALPGCGPKPTPAFSAEERGGWLGGIGKVAPAGELVVADETGALPLYDVTFSADGRHVALATGGTSVVLVDLSTVKIARWIPSGYASSRAIAWSPDGERIALTGESAYPAVPLVRVLDARSGEKLMSFPPRPEGALTVAWPAGEELLLPGKPGTGTIHSLHATKGESLRSLEVERCGTVASIAALPDGTLAMDCVWSGAGSVTEEVVVALPSGAETRIAGYDVAEVRFGRSGPRLAVGGADGFARVYELNGRTVMSVEHPAPVSSVDIDPSGKLLVTGASDGIVRIWGIPCAEELGAVAALPGPVQRVRLCPDGSCVVAVGARAGATGHLALWRAPAKTTK